jgi:anti-sigma B factor antagonist
MEPVVIEYRLPAHAAIEAAVLAAFEGGASRVVLDLDAVDTLDHQIVRGLIALLRRVRASGGELALRSNRADVARTLSVTGLDRVFTIDEAQPV